MRRRQPVAHCRPEPAPAGCRGYRSAGRSPRIAPCRLAMLAGPMPAGGAFIWDDRVSETRRPWSSRKLLGCVPGFDGTSDDGSRDRDELRRDRGGGGRARPTGSGRILSNIVLSQIDEHAAFGGVVPEIAARAHVEIWTASSPRRMAEAKRLPRDRRGRRHRRARPDRRRDGRADHGEGDGARRRQAADRGQPSRSHALTARLTDGLAFPYLLLLVSGGHTQFVAVAGVGDYRRLGTTIDDALGEAFDKTAKLLGLAYPGGPQVEKEAAAAIRSASPCRGR